MTIQTKDRNNADLDIASNTVAGAEVPLNQLADAAGTLISPATETTLATLAAGMSAHDEVAADGHAGMVILAKRRDSDASAMVADGDFGYLSLDENQRLKVSTQPATYVLGSGSITALPGCIDVALQLHGEENSVDEVGADRDNDFT